MSKFYRASEAVNALCVAAAAEADAVRGAGLELSAELGGSTERVYTGLTVFGEMRVVALLFDDVDKADRRVLKPYKGTDNGFVPRNSRRGRRIAERIEKMVAPNLKPILDAVNMDTFYKGDVRMPGVFQVSGQYYLELPDDVVPPGDCVEVLRDDLGEYREISRSLEDRAGGVA